MRSWKVVAPGPIDGGPLRLDDVEVPEPGPGQVRVKVSVCGVCRTDLHLAEGDLSPHRPMTTPGHEAVGLIDKVGVGCQKLKTGERVGVAWLAEVCGVCRFCRTGRENLCVRPQFTGWDRDGGFADCLVAEEGFVYQLPASFDDQRAAPLLCAGIVGYRALKLANVPPGGRLGIYGFGASAHLVAQVAIAQGAVVHVLTRSAAARQLAMDLGAASAGSAHDPAPESLDSAILFAPVGDLVPVALAALDRGGTLSVAGIYLSDIPGLNYDKQLFQERVLRSVTANTRADGEEFLALASRLGVTPTISPYPLEEADRALSDLAHDRVNGAAVLQVS